MLWCWKIEKINYSTQNVKIPKNRIRFRKLFQNRFRIFWNVIKTKSWKIHRWNFSGTYLFFAELAIVTPQPQEVGPVQKPNFSNYWKKLDKIEPFKEFFSQTLLNFRTSVVKTAFLREKLKIAKKPRLAQLNHIHIRNYIQNSLEWHWVCECLVR